MAVRVTDNFNRANVNPIAGVWSTANGGGGGQISSNQLKGGAAGDNFIFYNADSPPANHYAKTTFIATANTVSDIDDGGPMVRMSSGANGYIFNVIDLPSTPNCQWDIYLVTGGAGSSIATGTLGHALTSGDIIEARAVGTLISGYINGVLIGSVVDATWATGGYGVHLFEGAGIGGIWDNFEGGDFLASSNVYRRMPQVRVIG